MWTRWSHCAEPSRDSFGSSLSLPIPPRDQDGPDQISLAATARYPTRAELGIWNPLGVAQRGLHDAAVEPERRRLSKLHLAMDSECTIRAPVNSSPGLFMSRAHCCGGRAKMRRWPAGCGELTEESWMASMFHLGGALALGLRHWAGGGSRQLTSVTTHMIESGRTFEASMFHVQFSTLRYGAGTGRCDAVSGQQANRRHNRALQLT